MCVSWQGIDSLQYRSFEDAADAQIFKSTAHLYHVVHSLQVDSVGFHIANEELVVSVHRTVHHYRKDLHLPPLGM